MKNCQRRFEQELYLDSVGILRATGKYLLLLKAALTSLAFICRLCNFTELWNQHILKRRLSHAICGRNDPGLPSALAMNRLVKPVGGHIMKHAVQRNPRL
jgi:hypothetical protein